MTDAEKKAFILIRRKLASSRADIARLLGVSRPTASSIVQNLLDSEMIVECGKGKSNGGAMPIALGANADCGFFIGIDLGYSDCMSAVLLNGAGDIVAEKELIFSPADLNDIAEKAAVIFEDFSSLHHIKGIAVALPGIVDESSMTVLKSINPYYCGKAIPELLGSHPGFPVLIGNRSRMAACSEAFGGAADKEKNFAVISLGKSIGAALWSNGSIFNGSNCAAGEIRNLRLANGDTFENSLAPDAIKNLPVDMIAAICADGLIQLTDILDIELLILSGRFADFGSSFAVKLENVMSKQHPVRVRSARFGRFSAARGAAFKMGEIL